jgi:hypothetical protein
MEKKDNKIKTSKIKTSKNKKLFEIKDKGFLRKNGYSLKKTSKERKKSLRRASKEKGMLPVLRHLNAIRTLQKNNTNNFEKLDQDVKFVQKEYKNKKNKK